MALAAELPEGSFTSPTLFSLACILSTSLVSLFIEAFIDCVDFLLALKPSVDDVRLIVSEYLFSRFIAVCVAVRSDLMSPSNTYSTLSVSLAINTHHALLI